MQLSELIEKLQDLQKEYGDSEVFLGKFIKGIDCYVKNQDEVKGITSIYEVEQMKDRLKFTSKIVIY